MLSSWSQNVMTLEKLLKLKGKDPVMTVYTGNNKTASWISLMLQTTSEISKWCQQKTVQII